MIVPVVVVRWLHLFALMVVFGASTFGWLRQRHAMGLLNVSRLLFYASLVAAVAAAGQMLLTVVALNGTWTAALEPTSWLTVVRGTIFGHLFLFRGAALVGLVA